MITTETEKLMEIFGLSAYEAKIYLASVHIGPALISKIADAAQIPRTAVYPPLESMIKKGFVGITNFGKRKYYVAVSPSRLTQLLERKKSSLDELIFDLAPRESIASSDGDLNIRYFKGREGIKTAGQLFLEETIEKKWYSFENMASITELVGLDFENDYIRERVRRKIKSLMILSMDQTSPGMGIFLKKDEEQLRETIVLSPFEYSFKSTIAATKGTVIMINAQENPLAIVIKNPFIAQTLISVHKNIWDRYKPNSKFN